MAGEDQSSEDRTEQPTARHVNQARDSGNVPVSRELAALFSLTAVVVTVCAYLPSAARSAVTRFRGFLAQALDARLLQEGGLHVAATETVIMAAPVLIAAAAAGCLSVLLQTNFLFHEQALAPKWSRVNPMEGLKRIFGIQGLIELAKSIVKIALIVVVLWLVLRPELGGLLAMPGHDIRQLSGILWSLLFKILVASLGVHAVIAIADLGWVRFKHARDLRMSKQDIREEMKDTEGNPQIKARLRRLRLARARKNMMSKVPKATVVITNPTHYAVALAYDRQVNPAPRVVAKGMDSVAERIREVARASRVPIVPNPALARALYRLDLDTEIPAEHFKAVAEIIAFVWRLGRRANL